MKHGILTFMMATALCLPAVADTKPAPKPAPKTESSKGAAATADMEILRQKLKSDKKLIVSENMDLTDDEAKKFWPIYDAYQKDLAKINQRIADLVIKYANESQKGPISDDLSKKLVSDSLDIEKSETDLKRSYVDKLGKAIPPYKIARYAQIENKIRALVKYELAVEIPLID
jgi:dGTP triphosphohydrolase